MGVMLTNGTGQFCVRDIGLGSDSATEAGDALVCVTENTMCCRDGDGSPGGVGEWFINGSRVPGSYEKSYEIMFRNRGTGLVRLNVQSNHTSTQVGDYCCEIPDYNGVTQRLCVHGTLGNTDPKLPTGWLYIFCFHTDDAVCSDPTLKTGEQFSYHVQDTMTIDNHRSGYLGMVVQLYVQAHLGHYHILI